MITVSTSKAYHHGDLRTALVEAGLKALERQEIGEVSLRQLAREVGVSPTAVYRHFPDKEALMAALAQAGIARMADWQLAAARDAEASDAFAATGRAYVRWALANPSLFRLVFGQCREVGQTVFADNDAARMLREYAHRITGDEAGAQRIMLQAWAIVHGLAMLMLDGQLPRDEALIDRVIDVNTLFRA
ncbi:MAG: TetR/AcrR family transcriptional regulator [Sphingomonadaceae bacterium]